MAILKMAVTKTVTKAGKKEREEVGTVDVPIFILREFGLDVPTTGVDDDGLPTYDTPAIQWVADAVLAATKADARNKLESGSVTLKAGASIASTVDELIAKAERSGEALALAREFVTAFSKWLEQHSGKSAAVQAVLVAMARSKNVIALSTEPRRVGLLNQLTAFADVADEKFSNIIQATADACTAEVTLDDADF